VKIVDEALEGRTRDSVTRLIARHGPQTAAELAEALGVSPAAVRRHLDALVAEGRLADRAPRRPARRGRGRPARAYALTEAGRAPLPNAYDDLASTALRYLRETGGGRAVDAFADHRAATLERALAETVPDQGPARRRALALAQALSTAGYAADVESGPTVRRAHHGAGEDAGAQDWPSAGAAPEDRSGDETAGVQVFQHHCPVAQVAAEFPQLCEAETRALARVLGTYVQRLATIARGDGVCTIYVPQPPNVQPPNVQPPNVQPPSARPPASPPAAARPAVRPAADVAPAPQPRSGRNR